MEHEFAETAVIGAGPIGIEVGAALAHCGADYIHFEAMQIGATIAQWPPNTVFFSSPEWIAICGVPIQTADQRRTTGEEYLAYLRHVVEVRGLDISTFERVKTIEPIEPIGNEHHGETSADMKETGTPQSLPFRPRFRVITQKGVKEHRYYCRNVVIAIGDMTYFNTLGISGEDLPFVSHLFQNPHHYFRKKLLIVGGRNSALEGAIRAWRVGAQVTVCYHGNGLAQDGILARIRLEFSLLVEKGQVEFLSNTRVRHIAEDGQVEFVCMRNDIQGEEEDIFHHDFDFVVLATGYRPDNSFYRALKVPLRGENEAPKYDPMTMETPVAGVYIAGTTTAGNQHRYRTFITTCHDHSRAIAQAITGREYPFAGNIGSRHYLLSSNDIE